MAPRVVIAGYYGFGNLGDDAILFSIWRGLRSTIPEARFSVAVGNFEGLQHRPGMEFFICNNLSAVVRAVAACDLVVVGGGGIFNDYGGASWEHVLEDGWYGLENFASLALLGAAMGKPVAVSGVGVGPLFSNAGKGITRLVARIAESVTLRDRGSLSALLDLGFKPGPRSVTADPAFLLEPTEEAGGPNVIQRAFDGELRRPLLGVAVRHWELISGDWKGRLARILDAYLDATAGSVAFIPFQHADWHHHDDVAASLEIRSRMTLKAGARVLDKPGTGEIVNVVSECDRLLAMRYHAILFGLTQSVPVEAISYDRKIDFLMQEMGLAGHLHSLSDLGSSAAEGESALVAALCSGGGTASAEALARIRILALANASSLTRLLDLSRNDGPMPRAHREQDIRAAVADVEDVDSVGVLDRLDRVLPEGCAGSSAVGGHLWEGVELRRLPPGHRPIPSDLALVAALQEEADALGVVIYPPTIDWGFMFQRPQQMCRALAGKGFLVFYCTANSDVDNVRGLVKVERRLYLWGDDLPAFMCVASPILLLGTANNLQFVDKFRQAYVLYDFCDDLEVSGAPRGNHLAMLREADLVVASSQSLFDAVVDLRRDTLLLPNAVDFQRIRNAGGSMVSPGAVVAGYTKVTGRPVVGYTGALAAWFDYEIVAALAYSRPDIDIVLVGVDYDGSLSRSGVLGFPNVHWLGMKDHKEAMRLIWSFDVAIIPFLRNTITSATSPVKLYEYLACGKPVVSTPIPECLGRPGVSVADSAEEFVRLVGRLCESGVDESTRQSMLDFARENTWESRARTLTHALAAIGATSGVRISHGEDSPIDTAGHGALMEEIAKENSRLRAVLRDSSSAQELARTQDELEKMTRIVGASASALERAEKGREHAEKARLQRDALLVERNHLEAELLSLRSTLGVRLLNAYWTILHKLFPDGTRAKEALAYVNKLVRGAARIVAPGLWPASYARLSGPGLRELEQASPVLGEGVRSTSAAFADLLRFGEDVDLKGSRRLVALFSTTQLIESEGQRSTNLAIECSKRGLPVVFVAWRWNQSLPMNQDRLGQGILQIPIDQILHDPGMLFDAFEGRERIVLFEFPHPEFYELMAAANGAGWTTVYEAIDDWDGFHKAGQAKWWQPGSETALAASADLVTAVNSALASDLRARGRDQVLIVPNGVVQGIEDSRGERELPEGDVTVGYWGHMTDAWFDWPLVVATAAAEPSWRFLLAGYGNGVRSRDLPSNVTMLGKQPPSALASIGRKIDVAIVPFKRGPVAEKADVIKIYEYLAMGLPVVTTGVAGPDGASNFVLRARTPSDFRVLIAEAASQKGKDAEARRAFAAGCTWSARLDALLQSIDAGEQGVGLKRYLFGAAL